MTRTDQPGGIARRAATRLVRVGRALAGPFVNPPVIHASTVLFDSVDDMQQRRQPYVYGRRGTPTTESLETALAELDAAAGAALLPSGLSAATTAILSCVSAGDRILIVDTVYAPVRHFADTVLKRLGVETAYYDPALGSGIEALFDERTRAVYAEAPGSLTFEMQDLAAIAAVARRHDAVTLFDNTWATPLYFRPLEHGANLAVVAATKYIAGHSDLMLGYVAADASTWPRLKETHGMLGLHVGPDDVYLGLRGLRTLAVRLDRHARSALRIARWLSERPEIARVLYPPLEGDPGHALWKRDMAGGSGLLGAVLAGWSEEQTKRFIDGLALFGIGASWGGFESLAILAHPERSRSVTRWHGEGPTIRLHVGLEDPDDLIADLEAGFGRVAAGP